MFPFIDPIATGGDCCGVVLVVVSTARAAVRRARCGPDAPPCFIVRALSISVD